MSLWVTAGNLGIAQDANEGGGTLPEAAPTWVGPQGHDGTRARVNAADTLPSLAPEYGLYR